MAGLLKWSRTLVWVHLNRRFVASTTEAQVPPGGQRFENIDTINEMAGKCPTLIRYCLQPISDRKIPTANSCSAKRGVDL